MGKDMLHFRVKLSLKYRKEKMTMNIIMIPDRSAGQGEGDISVHMGNENFGIVFAFLILQ